MTFYGKSQLTSVSGLCSSHNIDLYYDNNGDISSYRTWNTNGTANDRVADPAAGFIGQSETDRMVANCGALHTTRGFFSVTPDRPEIAMRAALAVKVLTTPDPSGAKPPFKLLCGAICEPKEQARAHIALHGISAVNARDCATRNPIELTGPIPSEVCLDIQLNDTRGSFESDSLGATSRLEAGHYQISNAVLLIHSFKVY